jgi:hypothetical protein
MGAWEDKSPLVPGAELFTIADDAVFVAAIHSGKRRAEARRFEGDEHFSFIFEQAGGHFERCGHSTRLDRAIRSLFSIRAVDVLDADRARRELGRGSDPIDVQIRDLQPPEHWLQLRLFKHPSKNLVYGEWAENISVTLEPSVISLLDMDCAEH